MPIINNSASKFVTETVNVTSTNNTANATLLYTCPTNFTSVVKTFFISAGDLGDKQISIQLFDSSASAYSTIVTGLKMSSSTVTNLFDGDPLALQSGDQLAGFAGTSATGNFTLTLSTEEFFDPTR